MGDSDSSDKVHPSDKLERLECFEHLVVVIGEGHMQL